MTENTSLERIEKIVFPAAEFQRLFGHCRRKLRGEYLPDELPDKKAYGLLGGRIEGRSVRVGEVFPLRHNLRNRKSNRETMNERMREHAVPSETPFERRGWVADPKEVMDADRVFGEEGLILFGTYHMHRVPWEHDPLRDTCTEIDRVLAQGSGLWTFVVSLVDPERPIVRAFFESRNEREVPIRFTDVGR